MSEDRILNFVVRRLDDKTGFQTYSSGKKDDFYSKGRKAPDLMTWTTLNTH